MPSDEEKCSLSSTTFIVCSEEQLVKAYLSISITEFGISMAWSEVQCLKAFFPIFVTESGIMTFCREVQRTYLLLVDYQCYTL